MTVLLIFALVNFSSSASRRANFSCSSVMVFSLIVCACSSSARNVTTIRINVLLGVLSKSCSGKFNIVAAFTLHTTNALTITVSYHGFFEPLGIDYTMRTPCGSMEKTQLVFCDHQGSSTAVIRNILTQVRKMKSRPAKNVSSFI